MNPLYPTFRTLYSSEIAKEEIRLHFQNPKRDDEKLTEMFFPERISSSEKEFLSTIRKNERINFLKASLTIDKRDTNQKSRRACME